MEEQEKVAGGKSAPGEERSPEMAPMEESVGEVKVMEGGDSTQETPMFGGSRGDDKDAAAAMPQRCSFFNAATNSSLVAGDEGQKADRCDASLQKAQGLDSSLPFSWKQFQQVPSLRPQASTRAKAAVTTAKR